MNTLTVFTFACLAVLASARPSGHGVVLVGPSGVVTGHGPVGVVVGHDLDDGLYDDGSYDDGSYIDDHYDDGSYDDGVHGNVVSGNGATLVGATAGHAVVSGPVVGLGLGLGVGLGHGVVVGHGHGVVVKGPPTAPAAIVGPGRTGSIHAKGLWGPTHVHGLHHL